MENPRNSNERAEVKSSTQAQNADVSGTATSTITPPSSQTDPDYFDRDPALKTREKEIAEQDKRLLETLDEVLIKHAQRRRPPEKRYDPQVLKQISESVVKNGVGFLSLSLILIFLGVMLLYTLFSPKHDFLFLLKLAPVGLVLIGLEIIGNHVFTKGKFKIHIPSILISASLIVTCCILCLVFNKTFNQKNSEYSNRSMQAEIYDLSYKKLKGIADIAKLEVKVDLNPDDLESIAGISSLSTDDYVDITVALSGIIETPRDFARICKSIIDTYKSMEINVTNFYFTNESTLHTYNLKVEGKFAQDSTTDELEQLVRHIIIKDMDYLQDLEDLTDGSETTRD